METLPGAAELIRACTEALRGELIPALSGRAAFQARIVANVLDIVRRELEQGPAADAAELDRLRALCVPLQDVEAADAADADLAGLRAVVCEAIRTGRVDLDTPGLAHHLWADVLARVAIEQPAYPSFVRESGPSGAPSPTPTDPTPERTP
jgi:hypothetical protein